MLEGGIRNEDKETSASVGTVVWPRHSGCKWLWLRVIWECKGEIQTEVTGVLGLGGCYVLSLCYKTVIITTQLGKQRLGELLTHFKGQRWPGMQTSQSNSTVAWKQWRQCSLKMNVRFGLVQRPQFLLCWGKVTSHIFSGVWELVQSLWAPQTSFRNLWDPDEHSVKTSVQQRF